MDIDTREEIHVETCIDEEYDLRGGEQLLSLTWFQQLDWSAILYSKGTTYTHTEKAPLCRPTGSDNHPQGHSHERPYIAC